MRPANCCPEPAGIWLVAPDSRIIAAILSSDNSHALQVHMFPLWEGRVINHGSWLVKKSAEDVMTFVKNGCQGKMETMRQNIATIMCNSVGSSTGTGTERKSCTAKLPKNDRHLPGCKAALIPCTSYTYTTVMCNTHAAPKAKVERSEASACSTWGSMTSGGVLCSRPDVDVITEGPAGRVGVRALYVGLPGPGVVHYSPARRGKLCSKLVKNPSYRDVLR